MSFIKLQFKPGVNRDQTDYSNEGGWYECDKINPPVVAPPLPWG